jgi:hypothetical protein
MQFMTAISELRRTKQENHQAGARPALGYIVRGLLKNKV